MSGGLLHRVASFASPVVTIQVDGVPIAAHAGESVLAAVLSHGVSLRRHEADGTPRAGFCLMGACQDCWVWFGPAARGRACTTAVADGMQVSTDQPHGG